jgi:glycosyltransferase involved in cell wall biosynthesis
LVSIVIPCHNPAPFLLDAIASARAQIHQPVETILVDDGSDTPESGAVLEVASQRVDRYIVQRQKGLAAARNAGIRAASGCLFVPLDCDDILEPEFVAACLRAFQDHPEAAFVYSDYRVFGNFNYAERLEEYNLYRLLERNTLIYAALIRKEDWELAGGYNESMRFGCEDWDFWLRLAAHRRFGHHVGRTLFGYRKHGRSLFDVAREHRGEILRSLRADHDRLYRDTELARIKTEWEPAVCFAGAPPAAGQTIRDYEAIDAARCEDLLRASRAQAFLLPSAGGADPIAAEMAALAVWGGRSRVRLLDGSFAMSRPAMARYQDVRDVECKGVRKRGLGLWFWLRHSSRSFEILGRHFVNAELLSAEAWFEHPFRSAGRLIPLPIKERINRRAGRDLFDLTFYARFQPHCLPLAGRWIAPLRYFPRPASNRRRVALVTPHLGPGGAESVLLEIAAALDRRQYEILLIATQSRDARWLRRWQEHAGHVYDLSSVVPPDHLAAGVYSIVSNWGCDTVLVMNSLPGYSAIPQLKRNLPAIRTMDLIHAIGEEWDLVSCTAAVAGDIDTRIVISDAGRSHLLRFGVPDEKIRLIRNGIDLERFTPASLRPCSGVRRILFAGRLDPVKRPLILADIARALLALRKNRDFRFVVAGDGPEEAPLRRRLRRFGLDSLFEFSGHVPDLAPFLADADLLIVPSRNEGIPLVILEALASGRPVVASNAGAIGEVLDQTTGILIERRKGEACAFAEAVHGLLEQPRLRAEMGANGRRKVEAEYDRSKTRPIYRELFARSGPGLSMNVKPGMALHI